MNFRRVRLHLCLALLFGVILQAGSGHAELVDRIVAVVNNDVITLTEFNHEGARIFAAIRQSTPPAELKAAMDKARKNLLEKLIDNRLIVQKAKELKIEVTPQEIDAAINRLAEENNLTHDQLLQAVANEGMDKEEYRDYTADQIRRSRLINYEITSRIVIGEDRVRDYYDKTYVKTSPPPGYHLLQIGFRWGGAKDAAKTADEARKRAEDIRKLVADGQDFRELARTFSELPSAKDGGDLGTLRLSEMAPQMRQILTPLDAGQLSPVAEISGTMQFFEVLTINDDGKVRYPPFKLVSDEIRNRLFNEEMDKRLENWMKDMREQAIIKELL